MLIVYDGPGVMQFCGQASLTSLGSNSYNVHTITHDLKLRLYLFAITDICVTFAYSPSLLQLLFSVHACRVLHTKQQLLNAIQISYICHM